MKHEYTMHAILGPSILPLHKNVKQIMLRFQMYWVYKEQSFTCVIQHYVLLV